jgi:hypothetical protein
MKKTRLTIGTECGTYLRVHGSMPALLWGAITELLGDYRKFEHGEHGTQFDPWLNHPKSNKDIEPDLTIGD